MTFPESLRLKPPFSMVIRQCSEAINFQHPETEKTTRVPKGTPVMIHVAAIHRDPRYYENPMTFDPDRFLNGKAKEMTLEGKLLIFGGGPRICLGKKFALAQTKLFVHEFLRNFRVTLRPSKDGELKASPAHFFGYPSKEIQLNFERV